MDAPAAAVFYSADDLTALGSTEGYIADDNFGTPTPRLLVAQQDALNFRLDSSVEQWRTFNNLFQPGSSGGQQAGQADLRTRLARLVTMVRESGSSTDPQVAAYWAYHGARLTFFLAQMGAVAVQQYFLSASGSAGSKALMDRFGQRTANDIVARVTESVAAWRQDCINVQAGRYRLPWDMTELRHPQYNPLNLIRRTVAFAAEASATLQRSIGGVPEPVWMSSNMYPDYYTKSYHYQTDGWMSDKSASLYEHSTETLFLGRQDAMQRTALLPLGELVAQRGGDAEGGGLRLLEVACGTGRFHTYIKDNFPAMETVASDLSPFYLQAARRNIKRWQDMRGKGQPSSSGSGSTSFVQAAVEGLRGIADDSFDVVMNVYLFHELPQESRHQAASAMFRVLRPGGVVILTDSMQLGDRPDLDARLSAFSTFNEPYHESYVTCDLGALFREAGFECGTKYASSVTKVLTFTKP